MMRVLAKQMAEVYASIASTQLPYGPRVVLEE